MFNNLLKQFARLKFIYSEKATKLHEISTLLLSVCIVDKSKVEVNFVAFSEYTNFILLIRDAGKEEEAIGFWQIS